MKDSLTLYKELLTAIDLHFKKVMQLQKDEMCCTKGCTSCCTSDLTVCSIEAHYMKKAIQNKTFTESKDDCMFLIDNECAIYEHRPIVCRTQGLPLLYEKYEDDEVNSINEVNEENKEKELSVCEKNFHNSIQSESILDMEKINTALIIINKMFETEQNPSSDLSMKRFTFKDIIQSLKF